MDSTYPVPFRDGDRQIDWGRTSEDYAAWRPNYPDEFYERLATISIGIPGQQILDLGTGVGFLALSFARRGAVVTGVDVAEGQIQQARDSAAQLGLDIDFRIAPAEQTGLPDRAFDVITASQSWGTEEEPCITRWVLGMRLLISLMRSMARMSPMGGRVNL